MKEDGNSDLRKKYPIFAKSASELNLEDLHNYLDQIQDEVLSLLEKEPAIAAAMMHILSFVIRLSIVDERNTSERITKSVEDNLPFIDDAAREQVEHHLGEIDKRHKETLDVLAKRLRIVEDWQDNLGNG